MNIIKQFNYLKGQVFNQQEIELNIEQLLTGFENSGYPFAKIQITSVNVYQDSVNKENFADLYLNITSGELNKIDRIEIRVILQQRIMLLYGNFALNPANLTCKIKLKNFLKD